MASSPGPLCSTFFAAGDKGGFERITSKFSWDKKTIVWEIENISEAVGRKKSTDSTNGTSVTPYPSQEFNSMLDIDYINCTNFHAGNHPANRSLWSLSLYKQSNPEYLGLFLHLLEIESESSVNRRYRHNNPYDEQEGHGLYMKYTMSIISPCGSFLHKIENPTVINISGGSSWGEDKFIRVDSLWDFKSHFITDDTLRIKVDLWLFQQLTHTVNEKERECPTCSWEKTQLMSPPEPNMLMESLWGSKSFSDFSIQCGDKLFPVHKCIIAAASPVFAAMLASNMNEATENKVTIMDTEPHVLEVMLEYLYTTRVSLDWDWNNFSEVSQLLNACEKYEITSLKERCLKMVCDQISVKNAGDTAILVHLYNAEDFVKNFVYRFITKNTKTLRLSDDFVQHTISHPAAFAPIILSPVFCEHA